MNYRKYFCIMLILLISLISIFAVSATDDPNDIFSINANEKLIMEESIDEDVSNAAREELILEDNSDHISTDETKIIDETDLDSSYEAKTAENFDEELDGEINNNEITGNADMESILNDDSESNNLSNENIHINIIPENNFLYINAVDSDGNNITEGNFTVTSKEGYSMKGILYGRAGIYFNLFAFPYEEYPQDIRIDFIDDEGHTGNASYFVSLENTLIAHDVVDKFTFETIFLAKNYLPASREYMYFRIFDEDGVSLLMRIY